MWDTGQALRNFSPKPPLAASLLLKPCLENPIHRHNKLSKYRDLMSETFPQLIVDYHLFLLCWFSPLILSHIPLGKAVFPPHSEHASSSHFHVCMKVPVLALNGQFIDIDA